MQFYQPHSNIKIRFLRLFIIFGLIIFTGITFERLCADDDDVEARIDRLRKEIERTRTELEKEEKELKNIRDSKQRVFKEIEVIDKKVSTLSRDLRKLGQEKSSLTVELNKSKSQLAAAVRDMNAFRQKYSERLVRMYKRLRVSDLEILLSSVSFTEFMRRMRMLSLIASQDSKYLGLMKDKNRTIEQNNDNLTRKINLNKKMQSAISQQQKELNGAHQKKLALIQSLLSDEEMLKAFREEHNRYIANREKIISEVIRRSRAKIDPGGINLAKLKGLLDPPVKGRIVIPYGKIRDSITKTEIFNSGIDFAVREGTEVRCIADGMVLMTSFMRGYGNFIMIGHNPDYVSIYANLQEIQVFEDSRVVKGQVIGLSGQTGSLEGPKLHFELRKGSIPDNPGNWLKL